MRILCLLVVSLSALAQECRFVPLSPAQPPLKVEEGERATESQTFQTAVMAVAPGNVVYLFDTASRIRRIDGDGRMRTVAGTGARAETMGPGPALGTALANVTQIAVAPDGVVHFVSVGRVFKIAGERIEVAAGSGRPGFNGESGPAAEVNLGGIVNIAFSGEGALVILDGFNRVRRLEGDGRLRTIAGSTRVAAAAGRTGDDGPATEAALSSPRQVIPLRDGSLWLRDLSGRHIRSITADGMIRTVNSNFDASINILLLGDGTPAAATANRVFPLRADGNIETGAAPYPPFTGTPRAVGPGGELYFEGSTRPEQRTPLVRIANRVQTVLGGAPVPAVVDGQAPPFGAYLARNNSLLYSATLEGRSGIVEVRAGQAAKFIVGGGNDIGDADGKTATELSIFGLVTFAVDPAGRIVLADVNRRRILVVGVDGKVTELKTADGQSVVFAPLGTFSTLQRITTDEQGNIYWNAAASTPAGGVLTVEVSVWTRASQTVSRITIPGLNSMGRMEDGTAVAIAGNGTNFRSAWRLTPAGLGEVRGGLRFLPMTSVAPPYFIAAGRLFRGEPGRIEWLETASTPDYVTAGGGAVFVHFNDGGFYRFEGAEACRWTPQPKINAVVNAASYDFADTVSPRGLVTLFGTGLGPAEGQGLVLDGVLRAGGQPAPYPALVLGNFSGTIPESALTGTTLPVVYSNDQQVTVATPIAAPAGNSYQLYFSWQGLQLFYPATIRVQAATPGIFAAVQEGRSLAVYATGLGVLTGTLALGDFVPASPVLPVTGTVTATLGGAEAPVTFAGGAPGIIGGVYQVNVEIPAGVGPGTYPLVLRVGAQGSKAYSVVVR
ncbi:MAG: hypothetical protein JNM66_05890 [Bryobacterales bacterium]|nr:hypothetical protein [Bryobacterales bacterium]